MNNETSFDTVVLLRGKNVVTMTKKEYLKCPGFKVGTMIDFYNKKQHLLRVRIEECKVLLYSSFNKNCWTSLKSLPSEFLLNGELENV